MARDKSAAKRAKRKVGGTERGKGPRHPELHSPEPKERGKRSRIPPHPVRAAFSPAADPRQRIATLTAVVVTKPWAKKPNLKRDNETCTLRATLSDGRAFEKRATVFYEPGEREKVLDAVVAGSAGERELRVMRGIHDKRKRAIEMVFGAFQREFGRGVPAQ